MAEPPSRSADRESTSIRRSHFRASSALSKKKVNVADGDSFNSSGKSSGRKAGASGTSGRWRFPSRRGRRKGDPHDSDAFFDDAYADGWEGAAKVEKDLGDTVTAVCISDDSRVFAACSTNKRTVAYSAVDGSELCSFTAESGVNTLVSCGTGTLMTLIAGTFLGRIHFYNLLARDELTPPIVLDKAAVNALAIAAGGTRLAAGGNGAQIAVYSLAQESSGLIAAVELLRLQSVGAILTLTMDAAGELLAAGGETKTVQLWSLGADEPPTEPQSEERLCNPPSAVPLPAAISQPRGQGGGDSLAGGEQARIVCQFRTTTTCHSLALTAAGDTLAVGTSEFTELYQVLRWREESEGDADMPDGSNTSVGRVACQCEPLTSLDCPAQQGGVAFSRQGRKLAIGGNNLVTVFDVSTGGTLVKMPRVGRVRCVSLSSDGEVLLVGGFDKQVLLHHMLTGTQLVVYDPNAVGGSGADGGHSSPRHSASADHSTAAADAPSVTLVRSSHMVPRMPLLALGCELRGSKGAVMLFDVFSYTMVHSWQHEKLVWCVRLSGGGHMVAACGYDMALSLYSTSEHAGYPLLQRITYAPLGGPAFLWSVTWSDDSARLAIGCWNTTACVYEVGMQEAAHAGSEAGAGAAQQAAADDPSAVLHQIARVSRTDRVYAVDLDRYGQHVVVAGRDKKVAMYRVAKPSATAAAVAAAAAGGGRGGVIVGSGGDATASPESGAHLLWEVAADDFVYCVQLSDDMQYVVYGGTSKALVVASAKSGVQMFKRECGGVIWSVALSGGTDTAVGGRSTTFAAVGGEQAVVSVVDLGRQHDVLQLPVHETAFDVHLTATSLCYTHGALAYIYGRSGTHCGWQDQPSFAMVSYIIRSMLNAEKQLLHTLGLVLQRDPAVTNARDPETGVSLLQFVIQSTNAPKLLELLLSAACRIGLTVDKSGQSPLHVAVGHGKWRALQMLLHAIRGGSFSVLPTPMLSVSATFPLLASKYPLDFLHFISHFELQEEPEILAETNSNDVMLPRMLLLGSENRCPKGLWSESLERYRVVLQEHEHGPGMGHAADGASSARVSAGAGAGPVRGVGSSKAVGGASRKPSRWAGSTRPVRRRTSIVAALEATMMRKEAVSGQAPLAQALRMEEGEAIPLGYPMASHSGLQALRVPFENFAGRPGEVSPLELIVKAAQTTGDYSVFGCRLVEILLEFKWSGFAKHAFLTEFAVYLLHLSIVVLWNVYGSLTAQLSVGLILDGLAAGEVSVVILLLSFVWTTLTALYLAVRHARTVCDVGVRRYASDVWKATDLFYIFGQLTINVLFWLRDIAPGAMLVVIDSELASNYTLAQQAEFEGRISGRRLRAGSGGSAGEGAIELTGYSAGFFMMLQSLLVLVSFLRLLYYFRGSLRLGALVHTMQCILVDIFPLLLLLLVLTIGFSFALWVLVQSELVSTGTSDWDHPGNALFVVLNMGLYTYFDSAAISLDRHSLILVLYEGFMLLVQIIMLNLIIAIMSESNHKIRNVAQLVAQYERAKLVVVLEGRSYSFVQRSMRRLRHLLRCCRPATRGARRSKPLTADAFPRWLHVLLPAEQMISSADEEERAQKRRAEALQQSVHGLERQLRQLEKAVSLGQEEGRYMNQTAHAEQAESNRLLRAVTQEVAALQLRPRSDAAQNGAATVYNLLRGTFTPGRAASSGKASPSLPPSERSAPAVPAAGAGGDHGFLGNLFGRGREAPDLHRPTKPGLGPSASESTPAPANGDAQKPSGAGASSLAAMAKLKVGVADMDKSVTKALAEAPPKPASAPAVAEVAIKSMAAIEAPQKIAISREELSSAPQQVLGCVMKKALLQRFDLTRARAIASQLREPAYSLKQYYEDVRNTFPELTLYCCYATDAEGDAPASSDVPELLRTTSGSSGSDEYMRTLGAFFAIYWLMRIGIDGEDGFSYGVDPHTWRPRTEPPYAPSTARTACGPVGASGSVDNRRGSQRNGRRQPIVADSVTSFFAMSPSDRMRSFREHTQWGRLLDLLRDAGMLRKALFTGELEVQVDRVVGMLVLTAVHDIMKIDVLLPTVQAAHAPYKGFQAGDRINDHDVALSYVLDHYGSSLPSFANISDPEQRAVRFTQSKLGFNHGWLVQAEAPPGALFRSFKEVLAQGSIPQADVAFYFVHWLTDLAGAEPTPLAGSQKFTLKFPHAALRSFIDSFAVVNKLATSSETEVYEAYLQKRWQEHPALGPLPGEGAVAIMRLVVQVQEAPKQLAIASAFHKLSASDRQVLIIELALTGIADQAYSDARQGSELLARGPAFLVYYAPAFLRACSSSRGASSSGVEEALDSLRVLAELYRQARSIWPFSQSAAQRERTVTVRIDQIKEETVESLREVYVWGEAWFLVKRNDNECVVELHPLYSLNSMSGLTMAGGNMRLLGFWRHAQSVVPADSAYLELELLHRKQQAKV